jgi:preprotein translocase subunit SecE
MLENPVKFIREVRQETGKVVWPSSKETMMSTIMVLVLVIIAALFFWFVDSVISAAVRFILGLGT